MREYWSYCGEVADLDLMRFPDSGRFRGIAFITFATVRCQASLAALLLVLQLQSLHQVGDSHIMIACEPGSLAAAAPLMVGQPCRA